MTLTYDKTLYAADLPTKNPPWGGVRGLKTPAEIYVPGVAALSGRRSAPVLFQGTTKPESTFAVGLRK
jgi:hypothetical protein